MEKFICLLFVVFLSTSVVDAGYVDEDTYLVQSRSTGTVTADIFQSVSVVNGEVAEDNPDYYEPKSIGSIKIKTWIKIDGEKDNINCENREYTCHNTAPAFREQSSCPTNYAQVQQVLDTWLVVDCDSKWTINRGALEKR